MFVLSFIIVMTKPLWFVLIPWLPGTQRIMSNYKLGSEFDQFEKGELTKKSYLQQCVNADHIVSYCRKSDPLNTTWV